MTKLYETNIIWNIDTIHLQNILEICNQLYLLKTKKCIKISTE